MAFRNTGLAAVLVLALLPAAANAATVTPTRLDDPPGAGSCPADCSLRQAIAAAGAGGTVSLLAPAPTGIYKLTLGAITLNENVTIQGAGAAVTSITSANLSQLFTIAPAIRVAISGVTLTGATAQPSGTSGGQGGAIENHGVLTLSGVDLTRNSAAGGLATSKAFGGNGGEGGAIANDGRLVINSSAFGENTAHGGSSKFGAETTEFAGRPGAGGAIVNHGTIVASATNFTGNIAENGGAGTTFTSKGGYGGAILNQGAAHFSATGFNANSAMAGSGGAGEGGAISNSGGLDVSKSVFNANTAAGGGTLHGSGGAIQNYTSSRITDSTLSANVAGGGEGGAIENFATLFIAASTLVGNISTNGGAIVSFNDLELLNSTLVSNSAEVGGGAIENFGSAMLANATVAGNSASATKGGGIYNFGPALQLHDSIIAMGNVTGGTGGENCAGPGNLISLGYNLEDRNQCSLTAPGDLVNTPPGLGPLASNGGPTQTLALLPGSAAIDSGDPAGCTGPEGEALTSDQRGVARPQGARCDIGAFELAQTPPPLPPVVKPPPAVPVITALRVSPSTFRAASSGATIATTHGSRTGATISYSDSLAASNSFTVLRASAGMRSGRRCVARPRHLAPHRKLKRCTRLVPATSFTHADHAGANTLRFSGRAHGHKLAAGSYTLIAIPKLGAIVGAPVSAHFTIKR